MKLRVLDLFSGIGGFSLGLERAGGFETIAFCEIEPYCRAVLKKHWPDVPCYDDVRTLTADRLAADGIAVDVICGGFPCQDVSFAGKRAGLEGARSGLWSEYARLIGDLRPRFVVVENVPGLLSLGMGTVLGDLSTLGYDAVWDCVPASAVGAPHQRDRAWIVAYSGRGGFQSHGDAGRLSKPASATEGEGDQRQRLRAIVGCCREVVADTDVVSGNACRTGNAGKGEGRRDARGSGQRQDLVANAGCEPAQVPASGGDAAIEVSARSDWWRSEPDVGRVAHGISSRVDRLRSIGNAVVPQIPELIGKAIMQAEGLAP
jgi:DNA (cytosine-5)-methyltransferase 1